MPLLAQSDSDEEMEMSMSGVHQGVARATPPSGMQRTFTSKADLMNGIMDDNVPDYDFMDDSDDSDLEIYGQVKGLRQAHRISSVVDSEDEEDEQESYPEESQVSENFRRVADVHMHERRSDEVAEQEVGPGNATRTPELGSTLDLNTGSTAPSDLETAEEERNLEDDNHFGSHQNIDEEASVPVPNDNHGCFVPKYNALDRPTAAQSVDTDHSVKADNNLERDAYIKAEHEEASDDEGIHHDGGSDAPGSTIHVAPVASSVLPGAESSKKSNNDISPLVDAPQEVQTTLNQWWDARGRKVPPCATITTLKGLFQNISSHGKKATWLHVSGELLEPSMYRLTGFPLVHGLERRVIIVKGPTIGPRIVGFIRSGGTVEGSSAPGTRYGIWRGVDAEDADGYEPTPSVWKGYPTPDALQAVLSSQECRDGLFQKKLPGASKSVKPTKPLIPKPVAAPASSGPQVGMLNEAIPISLRTILEAWFAKR